MLPPAHATARSLAALAMRGDACFDVPSALTSAALHSLQGLRSLVLLSEDQLTWDPPAGSLPLLQQLALGGDPLVVPRTAYFPPSLTDVRMERHND